MSRTTQKTVRAETENYVIETGRLTRKQAEVLLLLTEGLSTPEIAAYFCRAQRTVMQHCGALKEAMDASSLTGAIADAMTHGEITPKQKPEPIASDQPPVFVQSPRYVVVGRTFSPRQASTLAWLAEGKSYPAIATIFDVSPRTVHVFSKDIFKKLATNNSRTAVAKAMMSGLLLPKQVFMP
ncbi:hypothetical protein GCM10023116_46470 [Kistimonas scapharcae]|uniref:HTH luxR-type domain-containing protein n=1 Tax=Kistimonas scapharcae TaxID=1036133 RepID=A0ABP8V7Z9_9GAMM